MDESECEEARLSQKIASVRKGFKKFSIRGLGGWFKKVDIFYSGLFIVHWK